MQSTVELLLLPLRKDPKGADPKQIETIFANLEELYLIQYGIAPPIQSSLQTRYPINLVLCMMLEDRIDNGNWSPTQLISDLFMDIHRKITPMYKHYCAEHARGLSALADAKEKSRYSSYIRDCIRDHCFFCSPQYCGLQKKQ
jgi:hypothetical protein